MGESKHQNYKPVVKALQMQSCQKTLTRNCTTKTGTYQAPNKVSYQGPETFHPSRCDE